MKILLGLIVIVAAIAVLVSKSKARSEREAQLAQQRVTLAAQPTPAAAIEPSKAQSRSKSPATGKWIQHDVDVSASTAAGLSAGGPPLPPKPSNSEQVAKSMGLSGNGALDQKTRR